MNITHAAIVLGAWASAYAVWKSDKVNGPCSWAITAIAVAFSIWLGGKA